VTRVTTHILDTALGTPAAGVTVALLRRTADREWQELAASQTDADGRVSDLPIVKKGLHSLRFHTNSPFFPEITVTFNVTDEAHLHIPLLLSPFGYSTYRGT
jgi:5-hydroxyisourate hydrolase